MSKRQIQYLDIEDLIGLAVHLFGDPPPVRDIGLLSSAAARPSTTVFGHEAYETIWEKGAALLHSIVKNHPLVDGNKRLGWMACAVFLEINSIDTANVDNTEIYNLVIWVASEKLEISQIAPRLKAIVPGQ